MISRSKNSINTQSQKPFTNGESKNWVTVDKVDFRGVLSSTPRIKWPRGNPGRRKKPILLDMVCCFDIETTYLPDIDQSIMYVWQFQLGDYTIVGRTWDEFLWMVQQIRASIGKAERLVVYVHNLSFEFSFLKGIYPFSSDEVFCMDRRKIAKCEMFKAIEFRCSYIHSNMSLDQYTTKMKCTVRKLTGTFDYAKIRYPWTPLTEDEMAYCINDVLSLQEALTKEMEMDGDDLQTIPLTSTGYVRRKCKEAMTGMRCFHTYIQNQVPDFELFCALREQFRGGNTHANHHIVGHILENVHSIDRSSSYPDVMVNHLYPISFFRHIGPIPFELLESLIHDSKRAVLFRIALFNVKLKNYYNGCPYLSKDKCRLIHGGIYDNGRILMCQYLETTINDIDWEIICDQYSFENPCVYDCWYTKYGPLPEEFRGVITEMYAQKTALKGDPEKEVLYEKIKAMINALYGMTAQNPLKLSFLYDRDSEDVFIPKETDPALELLKQNRRAFLVYQWGCWVTSWARWELQRMVDAAGDGVHTESCFVYTDTDSVKYLGNIDPAIEEYNRAQEKISAAHGGSAVDSKGRTHYLGVYEREADYDRFVTYGSKRYAYEQNGEVFVTTAGVVKRKGKEKNIGGKELARAGGLEAYKPGFTFYEAGGTEACYHDNVDFWIEAEGHKLHITDNVSIKPSEYTLGITGEYGYLLKHADLLWDLFQEYELEKSLEC